MFKLPQSLNAEPTNVSQFQKASETEISFDVPTTKKVVYSYDFILNKIQELEEQLAFFNNLKIEADKLNLTR